MQVVVAVAAAAVVVAVVAAVVPIVSSTVFVQVVNSLFWQGHPIMYRNNKFLTGALLSENVSYNIY